MYARAQIHLQRMVLERMVCAFGPAGSHCLAVVHGKYRRAMVAQVRRNSAQHDLVTRRLPAATRSDELFHQ